MNTEDELRSIRLDINGIGIIFYSPIAASHIRAGEDYLSSHYTKEVDVQRHIQAGSIVGFGTGSPGVFGLTFYSGYPSEDTIEHCDFKLRLAVVCRGECICVRDLYDLLDWAPECPEEQMLALQNGYYHVTLCSSMPASGVLGDNQSIAVYLQELDTLPPLSPMGIPTLCV